MRTVNGRFIFYYLDYFAFDTAVTSRALSALRFMSLLLPRTDRHCNGKWYLEWYHGKGRQSPCIVIGHRVTRRERPRTCWISRQKLSSVWRQDLDLSSGDKDTYENLKF